MLAGLNAASFIQGRELLHLPETTMLGALCHYITHADLKDFQPMKANFGVLPALEDSDRRNKRERAQAYSQRALVDLEQYLAAVSTPVG